MANIRSTKRHAREILRMLDQVDSDLKSARNWGIYDILGGKKLVGFIKHRKLDKADRRLKSVARELKILQRELNQIKIPVNANINTGVFNKFMDIFIDNTIANWYTQAKISEGRKQVKEIKSMVKTIYRDLDSIDI